MIKAMCIKVTRAGRGYNNMDHLHKNFFLHSLSISRLLSILIMSHGLIVFTQELLYLELKIEGMS